MRTFAELDWAIVPGPINLPLAIFPSDEQHCDVVSYSPREVVTVLEGLPGLSLDHSGASDWWQWKATYVGQTDIFALNMTLFDVEPPVWGGCELEGVSDPVTASTLLEAAIARFAKHLSA